MILLENILPVFSVGQLLKKALFFYTLFLFHNGGRLKLSNSHILVTIKNMIETIFWIMEEFYDNILSILSKL